MTKTDEQVQQSVVLSPDLAAAIANLAARSHRPKTQVIRMLIGYALAKTNGGASIVGAK